MLSKSSAKLIRSLQLKKYRLKYHLFVAEGRKTVTSLLRSDKYEVDTIWSTEKCMEEVKSIHPECSLVNENELGIVSNLKTRTEILATFHWKEEVLPQVAVPSMIYLDDVQDPGNVGTIIRLADWYGIGAVIRSEGSADFYAPKVVQSSMGSLAGVALVTMPKEELCQKNEIELVCSGIGGEQSAPNQGSSICLVIGNEGKGISKSLLDRADFIMGIQGSSSRVSESLNASMAASILVDRIFGR